jgi:hypothetical protein
VRDQVKKVNELKKTDIMNMIYDAQQKINVNKGDEKTVDHTPDPDVDSNNSAKNSQNKPKVILPSKSLWDDNKQVEVSVHSDLNTEQELDFIQKQASIEDLGSDDEIMSDEELSQEGKTRIENQLIKKRKQYRLVEINFPSTIIKAQGINRLRWDFVIITLAVYQAVTIPISIAFDPDEFSSPLMKTIDSLIDLVFILDIVLNFRTSFIESVNGEEILDPYMIAVKYLTELRFYIDVLSTIPLADLFGGGAFL